MSNYTHMLCILCKPISDRLDTIKPSELGKDADELATRMKDQLTLAAQAITNCSRETTEYYQMKFISSSIPRWKVMVSLTFCSSKTGEGRPMGSKIC